MALRNQRGRKQAYDNISVGNQISSFEKTIAGAVPPIELGGTDTSALANGSVLSNVSVGNAPPTTVINDDIVPGTTTVTIENIKVGG